MAFNLVKDSGTSFSKGYAFCEFVESAVTDQVQYTVVTLEKNTYEHYRLSKGLMECSLGKRS